MISPSILRITIRDLRLLLDLLAATTGLAPPLKSVLTLYSLSFPPSNFAQLSCTGWCPSLTKSSRTSASRSFTAWNASQISSMVQFHTSLIVWPCGYRRHCGWFQAKVTWRWCSLSPAWWGTSSARCPRSASSTPFKYFLELTRLVSLNQCYVPFGHMYHSSHMLFSGFSGSCGFRRGPWENHCNCDELLSQQVL